MSWVRGDIVIAALSGDYGKPRPCLVIQSDLFPSLHSVTLCPLTTDVRPDLPLVGITVSPTGGNGLQVPSQIAIDKINTVSVNRIAKRVGALDEVEMAQVTRAIAVFLGIV